MSNGLIRHTAFLSLGTNLGNKEANLWQAIEKIKQRAGSASAVSTVYETIPWGFETPHRFLNMAIRINTRLTPRQLLFVLQAIEREMGRKEKSQGSYQDRIIDIDILLYDQIQMNTSELTLPHPLYKERDFVMKPLAEILDTE